ncbi:MAG: protein jag [Hassallia sp.]
MRQTYTEAEAFLNELFVKSKLDLQSSAEALADACLLDINGEDASLLRNEGGELLNAIEHLMNQSFSRSLGTGERLICDVQSFRAMRKIELHAMAQHAVERVRASGSPFIFGPMDANERRTIHVFLSNEADIQTESIGESYARRLKVSQRVLGK